jgi:hypothetical protein
MNIIELAQECQLIGMRPHLDGIYQDALEKFAALVEAAARADEREALEKIDWTALMREGSLVTWGDAQELGYRVLATIRARGTT